LTKKKFENRKKAPNSVKKSPLPPRAPLAARPLAGNIDFLVFLFEHTHNYPVDDKGLLPWWLLCLGRSNILSASLERVLNDGKISWVLGSKGLVKSSFTHDQSKPTLFCSKKEKETPEGEVPAITVLLPFECDEL